MALKHRCLLLMVMCMVVILVMHRARKEYAPNYQADDIDLAKMLQYGEKLQGIRIIDRYGRLFDLDNYCSKPLMLIFVDDTISNINAFNDSLTKCLANVDKSGLKMVYVTKRSAGREPRLVEGNELQVFYDTDSLDLFNTFKVVGQSSIIILDRNHTVILSTISMLTPMALARILNYKRTDIY